MCGGSTERGRIMNATRQYHWDRMMSGGAVATATLTVELPEDVLSLLGSPEAAAAKARESLVAELLREGRISQGQAARALNVTRWDILDIMARSGIPSGPETADEMRREIEEARRALGLT